MNTHYLIICVVVSLLCLGGCRMSTSAPGIEYTLSQAGSNRNELFKVIRHYQDGEDSLKLKAALFLIGNMTDKLYFTGNVVDEFHTFIDSVYQIRQQEYDIPAIYEEFREKARYLKGGIRKTVNINLHLQKNKLTLPTMHRIEFNFIKNYVKK